MKTCTSPHDGFSPHCEDCFNALSGNAPRKRLWPWALLVLVALALFLIHY